MYRLIFIHTFLLTFNVLNSNGRLTETERVEQWYQRGFTWPPKWQKESPGYAEAMRIRDLELQNDIKGADERWENYMQYTQSRMVQNFTEHGFKVVQAPTHLFKMLYDAVRAAVANWDNIPYEHPVDAIYHPNDARPKLVSIGKIGREVHNALISAHEEWAGGIKLRPTSAYGVRLYQNGSTLTMHNDKVDTHVISSILHIDHEYDSEEEPWEIQIEDNNGHLHSLPLERGQMLFYESSKALHGRMKKLKGKYYGSIFLHYAPVDKTIWNWRKDDVIDYVPPHWRDGVTHDHGNCWAGQAITVNSRLVEGAPEREYLTKRKRVHAEM